MAKTHRLSASPTVVVVGAGFGGLNAARALRRARAQVVLLDRNNYHLFQPLLYQVATAGLEPEEIAKPVRAILRGQKNFDFRMVDVTRVDFTAQRLETSAGPIAYDFLVLAPGGETNFFGLESMQRHGMGLKDIPDAIAIRNHVLTCFEQAMLEPDAERRRAMLTFVVVGGGPTGVEMAGALSELIRLVLVKDYPRLNIKDVRILLLEATDELLAAMPQRLREAAGKTLWRKYIEVRFGASVADYDGKRIQLKSGEAIPADTVIWAAGVRASPLNATLGLTAARQGRIPVEPTLQVQGHPEVFRAQHHPPATRATARAVPLPRPGDAGHDRPQCRGRERLRGAGQRIHSMGDVARHSHHPADRLPQQAVRADQLGVGLLLLRARSAPDYARLNYSGNGPLLPRRPDFVVARRHSLGEFPCDVWGASPTSAGGQAVAILRATRSRFKVV